LEERALQKGVPRTPDEFDKLVRGSPDSSFVWINYMAFLVDLGEVEKARSVAER
jgi:rRNA biogenesis protein RRP5